MNVRAADAETGQDGAKDSATPDSSLKSIAPCAAFQVPLRASGPIVLHLPYPPAELQPNQRLGRHFGGMVKHKNQAKGDAHLALCEATACNPPRWQAVGARATFTFRDRRAVLDDDSLTGWLKATRDQIAHDFGMNDRHWIWEKPVVVVNRTAQLGVVVEIWERQGNV